MDPVSHRREGDLPWEWLGDNPLSLNSVEFRNLHRCKLPRDPICLHNPDIELASVLICLVEMIWINLWYVWNCLSVLFMTFLLFYEVLAYPSCLACFSLNAFFCDDHLRLGVSREESRWWYSSLGPDLICGSWCSFCFRLVLLE